MGADEAGTLAALKRHRRELLEPKIADHKGRIVKLAGDSMDELSEVNRRLKSLEIEVNELKSGRDSALSDQARNEEAFASALGEVTAQIQDITAKLSGRTTSPAN